MKVIVAGYPKTGTKTMKEALTILGYNVYDFMEHWWYHGEHWLKLFTTGGSAKDFQIMYKDVDAVVDFPAFFFWEEIRQVFPDAKVILTIRDENLWYRSFLRQQNADKSLSTFMYLQYVAACTQLNPFKIRAFFRYLEEGVRVVGSKVSPPDNEMIDRMYYRRHNNYVLQAAPLDKLLVFPVQEGWEPLCRFLGKDVPPVPFPHKNKHNVVPMAEFLMSESELASENLRKARFRLYYLIFGVFAAFWAICYAVYRKITS